MRPREELFGSLSEPVEPGKDSTIVVEGDHELLGLWHEGVLVRWS